MFKARRIPRVMEDVCSESHQKVRQSGSQETKLLQTHKFALCLSENIRKIANKYNYVSLEN